MREALDVASRFSLWMYECNLEHVFMLKGQIIHDIIMRRKAVQIMIKMIQRRLDAILHWNISFVGGFLGGYAILSHAGSLRLCTDRKPDGDGFERPIYGMGGIGTSSAGDGDFLPAV